MADFALPMLMEHRQAAILVEVSVVAPMGIPALRSSGCYLTSSLVPVVTRAMVPMVDRMRMPAAHVTLNPVQ